LAVTNRVLELTNGVVTLSGGNLSHNWTHYIALVHNLIPGTNKLSIALSPGSGLFKGTFTDTNAGRTFSFSGALLQKTTNGFGYVTGTNRTGRISIEVSP